MSLSVLRPYASAWTSLHVRMLQRLGSGNVYFWEAVSMVMAEDSEYTSL